MAYRTADYLRIQQLDFVVGIQVKLSNNHTLNGRPFFDICDELAGMYPKDFKFVGWHPSCRCYSVKVLKTMDEFLADERRLLNGEALTADSANTVRDVPPQFRQWASDNRDRIAKARAKGTESHFLRDNKAYVDGILDPEAERVENRAETAFGKDRSANTRHPAAVDSPQCGNEAQGKDTGAGGSHQKKCMESATNCQ